MLNMNLHVTPCSPAKLSFLQLIVYLNLTETEGTESSTMSSWSRSLLTRDKITAIWTVGVPLEEGE